MGHLRGLSGDDEEAQVYARWVAPFYMDLMPLSASLPKTRRARFVRTASVAAYWIPTPMIHVLYGSTEWRARIAASLYAAVHDNRELAPAAATSLRDDYMIYDVFMHEVALAVLDAPDGLIERARLKGPGGGATAALSAGGPRCQASVDPTGTGDETDEPGDHFIRAAEVVALVADTRRAMLALRSKDKG